MHFLFIPAIFIYLFSSFSCDPLFSNAEIAFFYGEQYYPEYFGISTFQNVIEHPKFDKSRPSVIYIHGYNEGIFAESVQTVISAYQIRNDHNIFALDWSNYSSGNYFTEAVPNVIRLGKLLGVCLNYWIEFGVLDDKFLHLVGHSLGGQMSGYIGKSLILFSQGVRKIKRITGLDPAKPLFYMNLTGFITYIDKEDAHLVDIIHTNAGILGAHISVGNCDFWPNGGISQPGCTIKTSPQCDHRRSWKYFAESVASKIPNFDAIQCESYDEFKKLNCINDSLHTNYMGFHATNECSGVYYLQTNPTSPFSRGVFGIHYYPENDSDREVL